MRAKSTFCLLIGLLATLHGATVMHANDRRDRTAEFGGYYDIKAERILEGVAADKGHHVNGLMYFSLKTADTVVEVQLGPEDFVKRSAFMFKPGDLVLVVGVPTVLNGRRVVLAREISGMNGTLDLRDDKGVPYGTAIRSERIR